MVRIVLKLLIWIKKTLKKKINCWENHLLNDDLNYIYKLMGNQQDSKLKDFRYVHDVAHKQLGNIRILEY